MCPLNGKCLPLWQATAEGPHAQAPRAAPSPHLATPSFVALVAAWDHLAQKLPKHAVSDENAALILNALKLSFAHSAEHAAAPAAPGAPAARSPASRALALASQLADLSSQVRACCRMSLWAGGWVESSAVFHCLRMHALQLQSNAQMTRNMRAWECWHP